MSGAGSGLAHQPDKYMGLINDQLNRDFEAQKQSAANQQNFLKLSQENELRKAQIGQTKAETNQLGALYARNMMDNLVKFQLRKMTGLLTPEAQAKVAPLLGVAEQNLDNQQNQRTTQTLGQNGIMHLKDKPQASDSSGVDLSKITHLQNAANLSDMEPDLRGREGVPSQDDMRHIAEETPKIATNRYIAGIYHNNFNNLDTMFAGQGGEATDSGLSALAGLAKRISAFVPPGTPAGNISAVLSKASPGDAAMFAKFDQYRKSQMADVVARMTNSATGGNSTLEQAHDIAEGLFPNIWDLSNNETRAAKLKAGDDALESNEAPMLYSKRFGVMTPYPRAKYTQKKSAEDIQATTPGAPPTQATAPGLRYH